MKESLLNTASDIASFYLHSAWPGREPHYKFMAPERMKELFNDLLSNVRPGPIATAIKAALKNL